MGEVQIPAGRIGEDPARGLSGTAGDAWADLGRLKTGTPPRLDGRTIDWASLEMQPGDEEPEAFSALTTHLPNPQGGLRHHPHHAGNHEGDPRQSWPLGHVFRPHREHGPRYCPSIEDKVVRFVIAKGTRSSWSRRGWTIPPSIPTAFPPRCRKRCSLMVLATILRPGAGGDVAPRYAIEYDHVDPRECTRRWRPSAPPACSSPARSTAPRL